jgi:superfamily II DNA or RNA helicase
MEQSQSYIGMVGSMARRMHKIKPPTLCFMDEGHHGTAKTWMEIVKAWPETTFMFLSATPHRSDKIGLDQICDDIICGPSNADLIAMGALSDYHYFTPSKPDLSNVHIRMGEYVTTELDEEMTKAKIIGDIVGSYKKHANGTRAVYFATSVNTSKRYAAAFNDAGISSVHLDADSSASERKQAAIDMAMGRLQIITNVGLFGEGFDLAAHAGMPVTIETVGLCRPTKSLPLLIQQQMRCMRAKDYPGIILDHAGCYAEHDFLPDDEIEWSLKGAKRNELVGTFQCQGCGATLRRGSSLCSYCGEDNSKRIAEVKARKEAEHIAGELAKIEKENRVRQDKVQRGMAKSLEELIAFGKAKGYSNPVAWAQFVHRARASKRKGY